MWNKNRLTMREKRYGATTGRYARPEEIPLTTVRTVSDDTDDDSSSPRHLSFSYSPSSIGSRDKVAVNCKGTGRQQQQQQLVAPDLRRASPSSRGSLFTNFEDVQLTDEERVYLNAAAFGDLPILRQSVDSEANLNVNCVDYMGRSALHLAVDSECIEAVELLMGRTSFECIEEALLHAVSKGSTKIVKSMIEHPNYIAGEEPTRRVQRDPFFRNEEKSQFPPDVTPLILAAHYNNHEVIQMFLSRGQTIDRPHPISCQCADCVAKQNYDSLKRSRSRLNAYRGLASPAYMALSSPDPIMTTFELRQEMKKLAQVEKEFKNEYLSLVEQCMNFACELMDLCRGTQEVEAVLSEGTEPLARLKMAIEYEEKKFVAHPNCQQHLTNIYYGPEMGFLQSLSLWKKVVMWVLCLPAVPIFCILYVVAPDSKIGNALKCPASKFITYTLSHISFLILLAAATFRLEEKSYPISSTSDFFDQVVDDENALEKVDKFLKGTFRPANILMTNVQLCLMFWVLGLFWMECKQLYHSGVRVYLLDNYNWIDFIVLSLYLSSYVLRFLVDHWIKTADRHCNGTARAEVALLARNRTLYLSIKEEIERAPHSYFMKTSRFEWSPDDPEIVSDVLFAVANVLSIARTTYLMPAFEVLGTLQISLGRMIGDITRFLVLFTLVLFAFMVGLHNLYWYYGTQTYLVKKDGVDKLLHSSESFQGLSRTLYSLFWSMFGLVNVDSVEIKYQAKEKNNLYISSFPGGSHATSVIEGVGMLLFAVYHVAIIIVLINMLIAMMSHSFEAIQGDCDVEWKFARTKLWMNYIDRSSTLPVPFNMFPSPKSIAYAWQWAKNTCQTQTNWAIESRGGKRQAFLKKRRDRVAKSLNIEIQQHSYADILQRLVRRYLFKLERLKEEGKDSIGAAGLESVFAGTTTDPYNSDERRENNEPTFVDITEEDSVPGAMPSPRHDNPCPSGGPLVSEGPRRRSSLTYGGRGDEVGRSGTYLRPTGRSRLPSGYGPAPPAIQLLSIPQMDAIQRTLRIMDVRLQHVQNNVKDDSRTREDIDHMRRLMSDNQNALTTVVTILSSIQEEVRRLSIIVHKQQQQQQQPLQIQVPTRVRLAATNRGSNDRGLNENQAQV